MTFPIPSSHILPRLKQAGFLALLATLYGCGGAPESSVPHTSQHAAQAPSRTMPVTAASPATEQTFDAPGPRFPASLDQLTPDKSHQATVQRQSTQNDAYSINTADRQAVQLFYRTIFASSDGIASGWTGNAANCNAGDTSSDYKAATLRRINWFRAMAGVPATVQWDANFNANAQQAAMLMSANNSLSHSPPTGWRCYNSTAATAAGKSNLNLGSSGAQAITNGYMRDPGGNNGVVGHRRWILYPQTRFMGTGDTDGVSGSSAANALWVQDSNIWGPRPAVRDDFVAWPARGYVPYTVVYPRWSFSWPSADFSAATVSMTENGTPIATRQETVVNGYGENTLVWLPGSYVDGASWAKPASDTAYQVTVSNVIVAGQARSFTYTVTVFDPDQDGAGSLPLILSGSDNANVGSSTTYSFPPVSGATQYQWRSLKAAAYALDDGAEGGAGNFTAKTSAGYTLITTDAAASGASSFHFAHTQSVDQTLQLNASLVGTANATLTFKSRLGLSSPSQIAHVEVSVDEGKNWVSVFQQAGQQSGSTSNFGESSFTLKTISLAQYVDKSLLLRWRYESTGVYYPQSSAGIGWYVDDIHLQGFDSISASSDPAAVSGTSFGVTPATIGALLLQVRPGMFGYFGGWSALKRVTVRDGNVINGGNGNDELQGGGGKTLNGGNGVDTAVYAGARGAYTVAKTASGYTVSGAQGTDVLSGVERLRFTDKTLALDIGANAGQAYRIYQAAFNRTPDNGGLKYWLAVLDNGATLNAIAADFINSAEFKALYGANPANAQFVTRLYDNVLHRPYDQGGFDYWLGLLDNQTLTRAQVLAFFSESPENQAGVLPAIQNGIELLP